MSEQEIEIEAIDKPETEEEIKSQLPDPLGWKVLVAMPEAEEKTDGGIIKATQTIKHAQFYSCSFMFVLSWFSPWNTDISTGAAKKNILEGFRCCQGLIM